MLHPCAWHPKTPPLTGCSGTPTLPAARFAPHSTRAERAAAPFPNPACRHLVLLPFSLVSPERLPRRSEGFLQTRGEAAACCFGKR